MPLARSYFLVCAASCLASVAGAQGRPAAARQRPGPRWEIPGLDITPNGGWRVRARAVAATRARLLAQRNFALLNAAPAGPAAVNAVTGALRVPVVMFRYQDSPSGQYSRDTAQYNAALFGTVPPAGRPYTLRSFYEQLSNGLFSLQGAAAGWEALAGLENAYTGIAGTCSGNPFGTNNCNGLFSASAFAAMQSGLREALTHADSTIDFGQFDNDGRDGIPNSGDDDGVVDAALFLHPSMDGACLTSTNNHLWSHRAALSNSGAMTPYTTSDNRTGGGKIVVNDYILQSGLGSLRADGSPCDSTAIMPIGTAAHELGHILALPDLYDVSGSTEGIGEFGLMGSGNYTTGNSPSRYDPWSLQQMGWTTVVPLTTTGTYTVGPVPTADTVFLVTVQGANTRNEYFLIENRQEVLADSAMLNYHCARSGNLPGCSGGLLIYHVDGTKACMIDDVCGNSVNAGPIHGVAIEEADGLRNLWSGDNRGDGGDLYPGTTDNTALAFRTSPAATKNSDTSFAGFAVDSIRQLVPNGEMAFRLRFGGLTSVAANDTAAEVQVDGQPYNVFEDLLEDGSSHTIAVADSQLSRSGRTRFTFQSWSDGGAISHVITGAVAGATYTATLAREHRLDVTVGTNGAVAYSPVADSSGTFILQGTPVTLTATPTAPFVFGGWTGDTTAAGALLVLPMGRPFAVSAHFDPQLVITSTNPRPNGTMGAGYADTLRASGGGATQSWQIVLGSLPPGLALSVTGRITGFPSQVGQFPFTVRVVSGAQSQQQSYSITVTAPTLAAATVLAQLLNGTGALTIDELRYLDMLGNGNCGIAPTPSCFDLGDFAAWVRTTGVKPALLFSAARKGGRP